MDWMYKRPGEAPAEKEEYLLGKSVDNKTYEESHRLGGAIVDATPAPLLGRRTEKAALPPSSSQAPQVDIARKVNEDPLVKIKLAEREKLKRARDRFIAHNIGKVKEMREKGFVAAKHEPETEQESLDSILSKKLDKFFESTRFRKEGGDVKKLNALIKEAFRMTKKELEGLSSSSEESGGEDGRKSSKKRRKSPSPKRRHDDRRMRSPDEPRGRHGRSRPRSPSPPRRRSGDRGARRQSDEKPRRRSSRSRSRSPPNRHWQEDRPRRRSVERPRGRQHSPKSRSPRSNRRPDRNGKPEESQHPFRAKKPKLSAEEMEKKRREMMDNAQWREEQRKKNVEKLNAEEAREEQMLLKSGGKSEAFVATIGNSVEDAIKANRKKHQKRGEFMSRD